MTVLNLWGRFLRECGGREWRVDCTFLLEVMPNHVLICKEEPVIQEGIQRQEDEQISFGTWGGNVLMAEDQADGVVGLF